MKATIRYLLERCKSDRLYLMAIRVIAFFTSRRLRLTQSGNSLILDDRLRLPSVRMLPKYIRGLETRATRLIDDYHLEMIPFTANDTVIDCGANVGDFLMAVRMLTRPMPLRYFGFEPGPSEFSCLSDNIKHYPEVEALIFESALAAETEPLTLNLKTASSDNSLLHVPGSTDCVQVDGVRLDEVDCLPQDIKLLKVEAEGYEPEVLRGAQHLLPRISYITADVGFERGREAASTLPDVVNFLLANGFRVVAVGRKRLTLLFINTNKRIFDGHGSRGDSL